MSAAEHATARVQAALLDFQAGIYSVPLAPGDKKPLSKAWQQLRLQPAELATTFRQQVNRGRLLGLPPASSAPGGFAVCIDLDTPEAVTLAPRMLPPTAEIGGRDRRAASHWFYRCVPPPRTSRFTAPDGTRLLELLSTGCQVVVPVSTHPCGEAYTWSASGARAEVPAAALLAASGRLAAATLLCRCWPPAGSRQDTTLALAGALLRAGWEAAMAAAFIHAVAATAGDEEADKRAGTVAATARRRRQGEPVTAGPTLSRLLGAEVFACLARWLEIREVAAERIIALPTAAAPPRTLLLPPALPEAACHGLAGEVVRTLSPHTEADPAALLFQFLTACGNAIGNGPSFAVEATLHRPNVFCALVGASSKARKGTSWQHIRRLLRLANDPPCPHLGPWLEGAIKDGLSSGEGLIWHVRDPTREWKAHAKGAREVLTDGGVRDKRLLIESGEFAGAIRCLSRSGNTLSAVLRSAWDSGDLRILTRNQPVAATGAHVSIIGHITAEELRQALTDIELANGFANRFLWVYVRRARLLPDGGALSDDELGELARRLRAVLQAAAAPRVLRRDSAATARWREVYPSLSQEQPGLGGAITARAEAHVVRLALLYALLDASAVIGAAHLEAALAAWEYAACSARYIFAGEAAGDPLAERLLAALGAASAGLTRSEISSALGHHQSKEAIDGALARLNERGLAHRQIDETRGRPIHRWLAAPAHALFSPDPGCAVP